MQSDQAVEKTNKQQMRMNDEVHLEFKVGPLRFCASVLEVEAIISPPKMIHVPLSEHVVAGCFNHQGRTATVLSMHNKFGLPFTLKEKETHIILTTVDKELKGFWVDQAIDIIQLNAFKNNADYHSNERKAYSNFLTRNEEIILQTSFQRLHRCASSNLNWLAGTDGSKSVSVVEDVETDLVDVQPLLEHETSEKNTTLETGGSIQASEVISVDNNVIKARRAGNSHNSHRKTSTNRPILFDNTTTNSVYKSRGNPAGSITHDDNTSRSSHVRSYNSINSSKRKVANKNGELFIMAAALLLLVVLGLGSVYLIDANTGSAKKHSNKIGNSRDSYTTATPITAVNNKVVTKSLLATELVEIAPSENQSLNEVAQEDETMPEQSATTRVFELHVDEKSDSNLYAITSFEPVLHQQEGEEATSTQAFTHIVVKGDTLWHITRRYLDNPHRYPELAAASHINNPHRIYPGDVIRIIVNRAKGR